MPKLLFYAGTVFALLIAVVSAAEAARELQSGTVTFIALRGFQLAVNTTAGAWAILSAFAITVAVSSICLRMASLLAARNLFASFIALFSIACTFTTLAALMAVQLRIVSLARDAALLATQTTGLFELHRVGYLVSGWFVSLTLLSLRPYFRIQASRTLSALVFFPAPIFAAIVANEVFGPPSTSPLPAGSPASFVFFALMAILFFAIAVHCIRHRHLFLEMTNLRELLDVRVDPSGSRPKRPIRLGGDVAFDS
jgi:hypothetical protein